MYLLSVLWWHASFSFCWIWPHPEERSYTSTVSKPSYWFWYSQQVCHMKFSYVHGSCNIICMLLQVNSLLCENNSTTNYPSTLHSNITLHQNKQSCFLQWNVQHQDNILVPHLTPCNIICMLLQVNSLLCENNSTTNYPSTLHSNITLHQNKQSCFLQWNVQHQDKILVPHLTPCNIICMLLQVNSLLCENNSTTNYPSTLFQHYSTPEQTKWYFTMKCTTSRQDHSQQNNCSLKQYNRIDHIITKPFTIHNCSHQQDCLEYTR